MVTRAGSKRMAIILYLLVLAELRAAEESTGILDVEVTKWDSRTREVELTCPPYHIFTSVTVRIYVKLPPSIGEPVLNRYAKLGVVKAAMRLRLAVKVPQGEKLVWVFIDDAPIRILILQQFQRMK